MIEPYVREEAACHPYDARAVEVARRVGDAVHAPLPEVTVEHVGSTSMPGCEGKGVVDLRKVQRAALDRLRGRAARTQRGAFLDRLVEYQLKCLPAPPAPQGEAVGGLTPP